MYPSDVWRGCLFAYLAGAGAGSLYVYALLLWASEGHLIGILLWVILAGAIVALPFIALAFGIHYVLAMYKMRVAWWAPVLALFLAQCTVALPILGDVDPVWISVHCAWIAGVIGLGFWHGAVGWRWSADLFLYDPG